MMKRTTLFLFVILVAAFLFSSGKAEARWWRKFRHADKNKDGVVDKKERRMERKWSRARSRVNTGVEQKYDANSDGWLEPQEAKELLKDRYTLIKTHGKAKVDTSLEEERNNKQQTVSKVVRRSVLFLIGEVYPC